MTLNNKEKVMRFYRSFICFLILFPVVTPNVYASNWAALPRVAAGVGIYELSVPSINLGEGQTIPADNFKASFYVYGIGITAVIDNYFIDTFVQRSSKDSDFKAVPELGYIEEFKASREDFSLSVGSNIWKTLRVFVGFKDGITDSKGNLDSISTFSESGYYMGGSYSWQLSQNGLLSLNAALADLDGELVFKAPNLGGVNLEVISSAIGASLGVAWSTVLFKSLGMRISIDANYYKFKDNIDITSGRNNDGDVVEKLVFGRLNLTYKF